MTAVILLLAFFVLLALAAALGFVADSRDPDYSMGRLLTPRAPGRAGR
ncbi:MAG TPA: hypothetical protein VFL65_01765 [Jatrophihabitans sp.]|nr:hypothetical protein [Jatrophihabitans sp.]